MNLLADVARAVLPRQSPVAFLSHGPVTAGSRVHPEGRAQSSLGTRFLDTANKHVGSADSGDLTVVVSAGCEVQSGVTSMKQK